jgi:hypothetical protein
MPRKRRGKAPGGNPSLATSPSVSPSPSPALAVQSPSEAEYLAAEKASTPATDTRDDAQELNFNAPPAIADLKEDPDSLYTVANVSQVICDELFEWAIMDAVLGSHRNQYLRSKECLEFYRLGPSTHPASGATFGQSANLLIAGQNGGNSAKGTATSTEMSTSGILHVDKNVNVECSVCSSSIAASRYAQHLEKCLGRGGRSSSRAASARLKASAERAEKEAVADQDEMTSRRRRAPTVPQLHGPPQTLDLGSGRVSGAGAETGSDVHDPPTVLSHAFPVSMAKRRKSSPSADALTPGTAPYGAGTINGRKGGNLPPSGRSRP